MSHEPVMPFGKHKDKKLSEVPKGYLKWALGNCHLRGWLKEAVDAVLNGRPIPASDEDLDAKVHRIVKPYTPSEGRPAP